MAITAASVSQIKLVAVPRAANSTGPIRSAERTEHMGADRAIHDQLPVEFDHPVRAADELDFEGYCFAKL